MDRVPYVMQVKESAAGTKPVSARLGRVLAKQEHSRAASLCSTRHDRSGLGMKLKAERDQTKLNIQFKYCLALLMRTQCELDLALSINLESLEAELRMTPRGGHMSLFSVTLLPFADSRVKVRTSVYYLFGWRISLDYPMESMMQTACVVFHISTPTTLISFFSFPNYKGAGDQLDLIDNSNLRAYTQRTRGPQIELQPRQAQRSYKRITTAFTSMRNNKAVDNFITRTCQRIHR